MKGNKYRKLQIMYLTLKKLTAWLGRQQHKRELWMWAETCYTWLGYSRLEPWSHRTVGSLSNLKLSRSLMMEKSSLQDLKSYSSSKLQDKILPPLLKRDRSSTTERLISNHPDIQTLQSKWTSLIGWLKTLVPTEMYFNIGLWDLGTLYYPRNQKSICLHS